MIFIDNQNRAVAFTGPRPEKLYKPGDFEYISRLGDAIEKQILRLINRGYTRFFSGMSRGVDMIAAERVIAIRSAGFNLSLVAAVPFKAQSDGWSYDTKLSYDRILTQCDETVILEDKYSRGCYHRRNLYMVQNADMLLAVYDGKSKGGTEATIENAAKKKIPIIIINPVDFSMFELTNDQGSF